MIWWQLRGDPECSVPRTHSIMKMSVVVATLVIAFATPALADYYVAFDLETGTCVIMNTQPTDKKKYKSMGQYSSGRSQGGYCTWQAVPRGREASLSIPLRSASWRCYAQA